MAFNRRLVLSTAFWLFVVLTGAAQPGGSGSDDPGPGDPVPISGIEILIGLGSLYGAKKVYDSRRKH